MATRDATKVLSTPKIMWNGRIIKIIPESFKYKAGGELKVRAVSSGGASISLVAGLNAEELMSEGEFEVPMTAENMDWLDEIITLRNNGEASTLRAIEDTDQRAFTQVYCTNKPEREYKAEGTVKVEWAGADEPLI